MFDLSRPYFSAFLLSKRILCTGCLLMLLGGFGLSIQAQTAQFAGAQSTIPTSSLNQPTALAVDANGNVYVADSDNYRVLKETPSGGAYTETVVGYASGQVSSVAVDANGNVYFGDNGAGRVLKATFAGSTYTQSVVPTSALSDAAGLAVDASGNLYISDLFNHRSLKETLSGGTYTESTIGSGLQNPKGIAVDSSGNVYIGDSGSNTVYKETPSGGSYVQSVVTSAISFPWGVAADAAGNVFIANGMMAVRETPSNGSYIQSTITSTALDNDLGIAVDANDNVYIAQTDMGTKLILKEWAPTAQVSFGSQGSVTTLIFTFTAAGSIGKPEVLTQGTPGLDFTDAGTGSCTTNGTSHVYSVGSQCAVNVLFTPRAAGPRYGAVVLPNSSGQSAMTYYIQSTGWAPQLSYQPGTQTTLSMSGVTNPYAMAVDAAGSLYIVNAVTAYSASNAVIKESWNGNGYTQSTVATGLTYPVGVAVDGAGNVYIADQDAPAVLKETPSNGGYIQSTLFSGLGNVESVAVDGSGNIYVGSLAYGLLKESLTTTGYTQSTIARTRYVFGMAVDVGGNLYVSTNGSGSSNLYKEALNNGIYTESPIASASGIGVAVDASENVYTAQPFGSSVYKYTLSGSTYAQSTLVTISSNIQGVAVDGSGNVFYSSDGNGVVGKIDYSDPPTLIFAATAVGSTSSDSPKTVTVTNKGNVALTFPIPGVGSNPQITTNFSLDSSGGSACPLLSTSASSTGTLAAGASCLLPISFAPTQASPLSGALVLTDNELNAAAPGYATQEIALGVVGAQTTPSIDWTAPQSIAYGTPLSGIQLNASSTVPGTMIYSPAAGTILSAGTSTLAVTLTPTNLASYTTAIASTTLTVTPATPTINWPTPLAITYGAQLGAAQLNATSTVAGTLTYTPAAGTILTAGQHTLSVTLTPTDSTDYTSATATITITVTQATPVITWPNPAATPYGTALSAAQLNATAAMPGVFTYTPAAGTILGAGLHILSVSFVPTDTTDYLSATGSNTLTIARVPLTITAASTSRAYGAANPVFSETVTGAVNNDTFATSAYSSAGTTSAVGTYVILPSVGGGNLADYSVSYVNGTLTVTPAALTVLAGTATRVYAAANPALTGTVTGALNGDTFSVTGATTATATSPVGSYPITYTVTGANLPNYTVTQATGTLTVTQATPVITWATPPAITYGTALSAAQLDATASTAGTFVYIPAAGTVLGAGTQTLSVAFRPTDTIDYVAPATTAVALTVNKAALAIAANNTARVFGAANPAFIGTIAGAVNGDTFTETFSTPATAASLLGSYAIVPTVAGANLADYAVVSTSGTLTITQAGTATTFALSNSNLTLTATVLSLTSGTPTGTVGFYEGQTLVGTGTLNSGVASYTATTFPAGNVVVTAEYSGDVDFTQSQSPAIVVLAITPAQTSLTVPATGSVADTMAITAATGFAGTLTFTCSGLPASATCSFSPATYTFSGTSNSASVTMTVQTGVTAHSSTPQLLGRGGGLTVLAGVFGLLTLGGWRRKLRIEGLLAVMLLGAVCAAVTACGSSPTASPQSPPGTSTVQVVAAGATGFSQTTSVTLTVQ
jgi:sugar lactone lactonase YvrE